MIKKLFITAILVFCLSISVWAQEEIMPLFSIYKTYANDPQIRFVEFINAQPVPEEYLSEKWGDGVINVVTCWTDVPRKISKVSQEQSALAGCTLGFGEGIISGVVRGAAGAIDSGTAIFPPYDEKPLMKAEYKVADPNRDGLKVNLLSW